MSQTEIIKETSPENISINNNENNESYLDTSQSKNIIKNGQFILTPLESLIINKKMPFGFKLDTEENILKSIENAKMKKKTIISESTHRTRPKKISEFKNYNNDDGKKYFRERKQITKEDYRQLGGKIPEIKKCEKCLDMLKTNEYYQFFYNPSSIGIPCLSEIEKNIKNNKYKSFHDFSMDLRKMWNYYFQTYFSDPDIYQKTCKMSEFSEELFKNFNDMIEEKKPEIKQLKEKLNNMEKGLNDIKSKGNLSQKKINNYDKPMTIEEKNSLGNAIRNLNKEQLKGIIKLLSDSKISKSQSGQTKYFEFDIDKLPQKKLRELEKYVKECTKEKQLNINKNKEQNEQIKKLKDNLINNKTNIIENTIQNLQNNTQYGKTNKKNNISAPSSSSESESDSISSIK
jgi:hypothetical protein